jgi:hypothetical protein
MRRRGMVVNQVLAPAYYGAGGGFGGQAAYFNDRGAIGRR